MPESETFLKYRSSWHAKAKLGQDVIQSTQLHDLELLISLLKFSSLRTGYNRAAGSYNEIREVDEVETRYDQAAGSWM